MKFSGLFIFFLSIFSLDIQATVLFQSSKTWGNGCPEGSVEPKISPDNKAVSYIFDGNMVMDLRPGDPKATRNCFIETTLHADFDEQFVVMTRDWRGYIDLPTQASGNFTEKVWLSHYEGNKLINDYYNSKTESFSGPMEGDHLFSTNNPEKKTEMECGQSFKLTLELNSSLRNNNASSNAILGIDSLDLAQLADSSIKKVPCRNPWKVELVDHSTTKNTLNVKVTTEPYRINQLGALYVAALYNNNWYFWSPNQEPRWVSLASLKTSAYPEVGSGNAPASFSYEITDVVPVAHGAVVYVGVGYGADAAIRSKEMLDTHRYKAVYTIP